MAINSKETAQSRADQITAFQAELLAAEHDAVLSLSSEQHSAITQYHDDLLSQLSSAFDIDASHQQKQLSLGMKIASFIGAIGIAASIFFPVLSVLGQLIDNATSFHLNNCPCYWSINDYLCREQRKNRLLFKTIWFGDIELFRSQPVDVWTDI